MLPPLPKHWNHRHAPPYLVLVLYIFLKISFYLYIRVSVCLCVCVLCVVYVCMYNSVCYMHVIAHTTGKSQFCPTTLGIILRVGGKWLYLMSHFFETESLYVPQPRYELVILLLETQV